MTAVLRTACHQMLARGSHMVHDVIRHPSWPLRKATAVDQCTHSSKLNLMWTDSKVSVNSNQVQFSGWAKRFEKFKFCLSNICIYCRPSRRIQLTSVNCFRHHVTWLILPVVICLSQRLSHACLSISVSLRNCEWLIKTVIVSMSVDYYLDIHGNSRANTCVQTRLLRKGCAY